MKTIPFPVAHTRIANKKRSIVMAVCGWVVAMTFIVVDFATMKQPQKYTTIESVGSCVQFVQKMGSPKLYYILSIICIVVPSITIVVVLHKDLSNHSPSQYCSRSIVTRGTLFLWSRRGEDNKNADCCRGWILSLPVAATY